MSLTLSLDHIQTSVEDVSIEVAEKSAMALSRTTQTQDGGESIYVLSSGETSYPATITYRSALNKRSKEGQTSRRIAATLNTWARAVDSVTGAVTMAPISATLSFVVPQEMEVELADLDDLLGNIFSFMYPSVSTKVRSTAWLSKLLFGISQVS